MTDWIAKYKQNRDGWLYCMDFLMRHPKLTEKEQALLSSIFIADILEPVKQDDLRERPEQRSFAEIPLAEKQDIVTLYQRPERN
jgi:hypothetical protein